MVNHKWNTPALIFEERLQFVVFLWDHYPTCWLFYRKQSMPCWHKFTAWLRSQNMFTEHLSICSSRKYSKVPLWISVSDILLWTVQLHTLPLLDHFLTNLISSSFARRNSSYSYAKLTRCGTTAWQLGLAWLLLMSKIRSSWVVEVKLPCCYWM